jgi:23S rRNA-/tRNA-specific pseudouridylate synthase
MPLGRFCIRPFIRYCFHNRRLHASNISLGVYDSSVQEAMSNLPLGNGVQIIDIIGQGDVIVFDKPAGILSHPNSSNDITRSLIRASYDVAEEAYNIHSGAIGGLKLRLINRLDSATGGILLGSLHQKVADDLKALFITDAVTKKYRALVFGNVPQGRQIWSNRLRIFHKGKSIRSVVDESRGVIAVTETKLLRRILGYSVPLSLVELRPLTGRTHQLRVHCAHHGFPIVGDATYGDFELNRLAKHFEFLSLNYVTSRQHLCLHSCEIAVESVSSLNSSSPITKTISFSSKSQIIPHYMK